MSIDVSVTIATVCECPATQEIETWISATLIGAGRQQPAEIAVRLVDAPEMREINLRYRQKNKPTNVLSFPCQLPDKIKGNQLGDLMICAPVVIQEAQDQHKPPQSHWAHLVVHGVLHLLGYDHVATVDAEKMEALEITILQQLGFPNPYNAYHPDGATLTHD